MSSSRVLQRRALIAIASLCAFALNGAYADSPPVWQANVYYAVGSIVSYQGGAYVALVSQIDYPSTDWNPTSPLLWKRLGNYSAGSDRKTEAAMTALYADPESGIVRATEKRSPGCALEWNSTNVYTTGGVASIGGVNYKARWWTRVDEPSKHNGEINQPWEVVGICAAVSPTVEANDSNESRAPSDGQRAAQASSADDRG